jgi:hypothetical protein
LPLAVAALFLTPVSASAAALDVVNVGAPAINCAYNTACTITVNDSIGTFTPPGDGGAARLQSRTFVGQAPAPLAGKMGYLYRIDLTQATAPAAGNCVIAMQITFGPVVKGPYTASGMQDVYVVADGGLGSVGIASAKRTGRVVLFNFAAGGVCPGLSSYFFGLTSSRTTPVAGTAKLFYSAGGMPGTVDMRVP